MKSPIRVAIVGLGKIAVDQHLPVLAANPDLDLCATVSQRGDGVEGVPAMRDLEALAASGIAVDAVALCTPPQVRRRLASEAIAHGWHVFLEKPPTATVAEAVALRDEAAAAGVTLFASWHSRYAPGVEPARDALTGRTIAGVTVTWHEDVRRWHPGQRWIWEPGGFGVFDPGINALSIVTDLLPAPLFVETAAFGVPANCAAPTTARVGLRDAAGVPVTLDLDFQQSGEQRWEIAVDTGSRSVTLTAGGARLAIDGRAVDLPDDPHHEYAMLYRRFADLVRAGASDVDLDPLLLVADSFMRARVTLVEDFVE